MEHRRDRTARIIFFAALAVLYVVLFLLLRQTNLFQVSGRHNDWLFSCDDLYYSTRFFSADMDTSARIIKHPLLVVFGWLFTRAEGVLFGPISVSAHYCLIVVMQMAASYLTVLLLDRILEEQWGLRAGDALLMCAAYALAFSNLFYTFVAESFILSGLVLMAGFYFAGRKNYGVTAVLGVLCAGVTITNALLWAAIVWLSGWSWRRKLAVSAAAGVCFCALVALLPVRTVFYTTILHGAVNSARNYSDSFPVLEWAARVFFVFFGSTAFYLDTAEQSPFGDFAGDALSFLPSAPVWIVLVCLAWLGLLVLAAIRGQKDRRLWPVLGVLGLNLVLHGVIQYGLKEGFLYSLHHFGAQVLLAASLLGSDRREHRAARISMAIWLVCLIGFNLPGYIRLAEFLLR